MSNYTAGVSATDIRMLTPSELAAWRGLLVVHSHLFLALDRELEEAHGLPLRAYEVLLHLGDAPGGRLRMTELAASVLLSQSGVTRLVDRLEHDALVRREPCEEDRRGHWAVLTDEGRRLFQEARPTHLTGVRRLFHARLEGDDLATLARCWEAVVPGSTA